MYVNLTPDPVGAQLKIETNWIWGQLSPDPLAV